MAGGLFAFGDYLTNMVMGARYRRQQYQYQLREHQYAIDNATRAIQEFQQQKTYNRAILGQSFAARGLSNSTISQQGTSNFDATAARREAALNQNLSLQNYGMTLLKTYHRYQQRMMIYNGVRSIAETAVGAFSLMSGGGAGDTGSEQGTDSTSDPTGNAGWNTTAQGQGEYAPGDNAPFADTGANQEYAASGYGDQSNYGGQGSDYGGGGTE